VALALAAAGQFDRAIVLQQKLVAEAESAGKSQRVEVLRARLQSFELRQEWRAKAPDEIIVAMMASAPRPTG
jgi:hypothetical protein